MYVLAVEKRDEYKNCSCQGKVINDSICVVEYTLLRTNIYYNNNNYKSKNGAIRITLLPGQRRQHIPLKRERERENGEESMLLKGGAEQGRMDCSGRQDPDRLHQSPR